jgi:hypothetical protein
MITIDYLRTKYHTSRQGGRPINNLRGFKVNYPALVRFFASEVEIHPTLGAIRLDNELRKMAH